MGDVYGREDDEYHEEGASSCNVHGTDDLKDFS